MRKFFISYEFEFRASEPTIEYSLRGQMIEYFENEKKMIEI